jgi:hypothetical protein
MNKKNTKDCRKCKGTGLCKINFSGDLQAMIANEVTKIVQTDEFKNEMQQKIEDAKAVHEGITCSGCEVSPIRGIRFTCSKREKYDLCEKCEAKMAKDLPYPMWKVREPKHMAMSIMCQYADNIVLEQEVSDAMAELFPVKTEIEEPSNSKTEEVIQEN